MNENYNYLISGGHSASIALSQGLIVSFVNVPWADGKTTPGVQPHRRIIVEESSSYNYVLSNKPGDRAIGAR